MLCVSFESHRLVAKPSPMGLRELGPSPRPGRRAGAGHADMRALRAGGTPGRHDQDPPWAPSCAVLGPRPSTGEPGVAGTIAWQAGKVSVDSPLTIDLDHTICGLAKEGARHHGYTGRGYHPLLAVAAGRRRAECRLREGRANTARGAAHFLSGRVRYGGASGQLAGRQIAWYPSAASWTCASPSASTKACGT